MSNLPFDPLHFPAPEIRNKLAEVKPAESRPSETGPTFGQLLENAISQVNELQAEAGHEVQKLMAGEVKDIHTAMIAVQKADISFQMMMQVRNKLVTAYQEIMRMQV
ncbi:MAG: flagellar hook-basal body complex protein FliE [Acidobacteriota bacterium]